MIYTSLRLCVCVVFLVFLDMITSLWIILQFRARLAMLQKNLKGCKKEIKSLSVIENAVSNCDAVLEISRQKC